MTESVEPRRHGLAAFTVRNFRLYFAGQLLAQTGTWFQNLAIALLNEPTLLLLDEPYAGFDWETYQVFWSLAGSLRDSGTTILIISHFLHEQERFDRILRLVNGTLESGGH